MDKMAYRPDRGQRTLFDLTKVVRMEQASVLFTHEGIEQIKKQLLDPNTPMHDLMRSLRKLDCYKIQATDLLATDISCAVATVAYKHPKEHVSRLGGALLEKWRPMVDAFVFRTLPYDTEVAELAPEGEEEAPNVAIKAERRKKRRDERIKREGEAAYYFDTSDTSDDEEIYSEDGDPTFAPSSRPLKPNEASDGAGNDPFAVKPSKKRASLRLTLLNGGEEAYQQILLQQQQEGRMRQKTLDIFKTKKVQKTGTTTDAVTDAHDDNIIVDGGQLMDHDHQHPGAEPLSTADDGTKKGEEIGKGLENAPPHAVKQQQQQQHQVGAVTKVDREKAPKFKQQTLFAKLRAAAPSVAAPDPPPAVVPVPVVELIVGEQQQQQEQSLEHPAVATTTTTAPCPIVSEDLPN